MDLKFNESQHARIKLTRTQRKLIRRMYSQAHKEIKNKIEKLGHFENVSPISNINSLRQLAKDIEEEYGKLGAKLEEQIINDMIETSNEVIKTSANFAITSGLVVGSGYYNLPTEIVNRIIAGKVYEKRWSLSNEIWKQSSKIRKDINVIIAKGVTLNKSAYDIAKDLEKYVNPSARKDWEWSKVYPGTNRKIDYNAQRLARTLVSHAYQQSIVTSTKDNPFVKGIRWLTSNSHRVCPICLERDGKVYKPEDLPLDHPNGMCTFEAVIEESMDDVAKRIADWYNGKEDFEIDKYAKSLI